MDTVEINEALAQVYTLPHGRVRVERLEILAAAAKSGPDRHLEGRVLLELVESYAYASERDLAPVAYARLLRIYDEHPAELGPLTYSVHWYLKWMTWGLIDNPAVPLPTVYRWFDELENRYGQRGYSLRPVFALRAQLARQLGDREGTARWHEQAMAAPRDSMSDCEACERNEWGSGSAASGDDVSALAHWQPVIDGELGCAEEPHRVLAQALLPLLRTGRVAAARGAHLTGYPLVRHSESLRPSVAAHIEFCALTGNEGRGLEILAEHSRWVGDPGADVGARLAFITGVCVLLRRLVTLGLGYVRVADGTVDSVLAELDTEIAGLCARYDLRNRNGAVSSRVAARLAGQPLVERLPLGLRSRLPRVVRTSAAVALDSEPSPEVVSSEDDRLAEVLRLAEFGAAQLADAPEVAEARLREALAIGGAVLPAEHLARLSSQLCIAIAGQPDRELDLADAAIRAAARWEALSEPDLLHHTVIAARACHRGRRHGEAVALFEEALAADGLPYPPAEIATVRAQFGESLNALHRYHEAARQFAEAARLVERDPDRREQHAGLALAAATALEYCDQDEAAGAAYQRAAALFGDLGQVVPRARCLRSAAWLQVWGSAGPDRPWLSAMQALIAELAGIDSDSSTAAVAAELAQTRRELREMLDAADGDRVAGE